MLGPYLMQRDAVAVMCLESLQQLYACNYGCWWYLVTQRIGSKLAKLCERVSKHLKHLWTLRGVAPLPYEWRCSSRN